MKYLFQHIVLLLTILLLFSACIREDYSPDNGTVDPNDGQVQVELFTRSYGFNTPVTRAGAQENFVGRDPWVLVFKGSTDNAVFVEAAQAYTFTGIDKTFVNLTSTTDACRLLILANPRNDFYLYDGSQYNNHSTANFNTVLAGKTLSEVCSTLFTEPLNNPQTVVPFINEPLTMSYVYNATDGISTGTKIENNDNSALGLIRTVAKMVLTNTDPNFKLHGINLIKNVPGRGLLCNLHGAWPGNVDLIDYQPNSGYIVDAVDDSPALGQQTTTGNPIYLYEFEKTNKTYLIIQGTYALDNKGNPNSDAVPTYYKMGIVDKNESLLDVLRNHEYTFTISKVKGPGYKTLDDAIVSKALNVDLDFEIKVTDTSAYEIIANNDYYLSISNSVFIAYTSTDQNYSAFDLATNCTVDFPNTRTISDNKAEVDWSFNLSYPSVINIANNSGDIATTSVNVDIKNWLKWYESPQWYEGVQKKDAYITLNLGNLEKKVHIRQRDAVPKGGGVYSYKPIVEDEGNPNNPEIKYYCLSGYVVGDAKNWIKLTSSNNIIKNDSASITVDDGIINLHIDPYPDGLDPDPGQRNGIVYLTTIKEPGNGSNDNSAKRIKIDITQLGQ